MTDFREVSVELRFSRKRYERPPQAVFLFDAVLRNASQISCWFLLPASLPLAPEFVRAGTSGVEVFTLPGIGRAVLGRFYGTAGFQALLLPRHSFVKIRDFAIYLDLPLSLGSQSWDAVVATGLKLGDESAESWFGLDPLCDQEVDVSQENSEIVSSHHTPDLHEVPVILTGEKRIVLRISNLREADTL